METSRSETNLIFEPRTASVPASMLEALSFMGNRLADCGAVWLVGGSCGALLQGVALDTVPRDLDVYVDADNAGTVHRALSSHAVDEQTYSETGMYRSLLSHYRIEGVQVELVGSLTVRIREAEYEVRVDSLLARHAAVGTIRGVPIRFMPLAHELVFNVLRDRPDRYEPIAKAMRAQPAVHEPMLEELLRDNRIGAAYADRLRELLRPLSREGEADGDARDPI